VLKHYILLRYKPGVGEDHIQAFCEKARAMQTDICEIEQLLVGRDVLHEARSWDVIMDLTVASVEALRSYQKHPVHQALMAFNGDLVADVAAIDFYL